MEENLSDLDYQRGIIFDFLEVTSPSMSIDDKYAIVNSYFRNRFKSKEKCMEEKLYNLKMQILRDVSIDYELKKDLVNQIYEIDLLRASNDFNARFCECEYPLIRSGVDDVEYCGDCCLDLKK